MLNLTSAAIQWTPGIQISLCSPHRSGGTWSARAWKCRAFEDRIPRLMDIIDNPESKPHATARGSLPGGCWSDSRHSWQCLNTYGIFRFLAHTSVEPATGFLGRLEWSDCSHAVPFGVMFWIPA